MDMGFWSSVFSASAALFTSVTAGVALWITFRSDRAEKDHAFDSSVMERCEIYLSRGFEALASGKDGEALPETPSRYGWLTAARMISEYKAAFLEIKLEKNKVRIIAIKEYWRFRFIALLSVLDNDVSYFDFKDDDANKAGFTGAVQPKSAKIIFDFMRWPEGKEDSIDHVNEADLIVPMAYRNAMNAINRNSRRIITMPVRGA